MAKSAGANVVPLGDHPRARSRLSPGESADVITGCRELALERMSQALGGMLDRVEDDLFELADKSVERDAQNTYLEARSQARDKRALIESTFHRHFRDCFNRQVRGDAPPAESAAAPTQLALVADEELEESLAVREMARRLGAACEGELHALSQRMGFLLERPELADDANPVGPANICAALKDACDQIESGFKVRMALLRQLESHAEGAFQGVYQELNAHLVERRILPHVRHAVRRAAPVPKPAATPLAQAGPGADLFGTLAQLLGAVSAAAGPAPAAPAGAPPFAGASPGPALPSGPAAPEAGTSSAPQSFLAELTRMHREQGPGAAPGGAQLLNVVKGIRAAPQSASLGPVDAMTIDIVAMLFDYIFEDRHIPASVKALLGRLQIPTLKVALLDKDFFSSRSHPARRLLDLLAESAIGLDEGNAGGSQVLGLIGSVVDSVLADFDTDLALFESLVTRVEAFIEERRVAETSVVEHSARLVEERERVEIARLVAEDEVARRLHMRAWVPPAVRVMCALTWVDALARVQAAEGEGSPRWQALLVTLEDLLWSVEPKVNADDRKRLVTMLPGMLRGLAEGFARADMPDEARDDFLGALVDCHASAVKAGLRGLAALPETPPPQEPQSAAIARERIPAGDIQVEEIRLRAPRGQPTVRNVFTRTGIWTNLPRGTWVEFAGAPAMRARLTWISPNKGVYLFTNPLSSAAAVSISPEALAEQMRLGDARLLDDAPLVDRAVGSMLASLRDKTAAADNPSP
jgi:hypothetical protein